MKKLILARSSLKCVFVDSQKLGLHESSSKRNSGREHPIQNITFRFAHPSPNVIDLIVTDHVAWEHTAFLNRMLDEGISVVAPRSHAHDNAWLI